MKCFQHCYKHSTSKLPTQTSKSYKAPTKHSYVIRNSYNNGHSNTKNQFITWREEGANGKLHEDGEGTIVYGYNNFLQNPLRQYITIPDYGGCFGYVHEGQIEVLDQEGELKWKLKKGQWFSTRSGCVISSSDPKGEYFSKVSILIVQKQGYTGVHSAGGPVEKKGRLRYIDGCSDSLLVFPQIYGDPCLNHLHFPCNINQTQHTHPSVRVGIVSQGEGECVTPFGNTPLQEGIVFVIPKDTIHSFKTQPDKTLDVISYHPDSDWGPKHEDHPMVNKTIIDGVSAAKITKMA